MSRAIEKSATTSDGFVARRKIIPADGAHRHKRDLPEGEFPAPRYGPLCSRGQARRNGALIRHFLNRNVR
jgi:hypothetical protein